MSELEKMRAGQWYSCLDPQLEDLRVAARVACHAHRVDQPGANAGPLVRLFAKVGEGCFVEAPFHCSYGMNITLGAQVYLNANCVILDSAAVTIGDGSMLGPGVHIYCADHHRDPQRRRAGIERALPVAIGKDVWLGGGVLILPGISIGDSAVVGAGAVVTRGVPAGARVVGNPARIVD